MNREQQMDTRCFTAVCLLKEVSDGVPTRLEYDAPQRDTVRFRLN